MPVRRAHVSVLCAGLLALPAAAAAPADAGTPLISYLNQAVAWYRGVVSMAPLATDPAEVLVFTDARTTALEVLRLAFDFAHADVALVPASAPPQNQAASGGMSMQTLSRLVAEADARVRQAQADIDGLQRAIAAARSRGRRATLARQLTETQSELRLAQARKDTLTALSTFRARAQGAGATLAEQIDALERSVPELHGTTASSTAAPTASTASRTSSDRGVLPLFAELFALIRKDREIRDVSTNTANLRSTLERLRTPFMADLRSTLQQGDELTQAPQSTNPAVLQDRTRKVDDVTAHFKKVSGVLVPLGKQTVLLDGFSGHLAEWDKLIDRQTSIDARGVVLRLALVALGVGVLLAASDFWRRATFRYVQDVRRRQQFLLLRRIVVTAAILIFVLFALVTELSSLATFAGFITAGLAIALQNVILSVVAYFFLIGKYGVRVGDRVQISGVTGDVIDLGLMRLHLMEIGADGHETGRVVVFSNAVLFQPTANFFKQLPGSNFTWHSVRLMLAPDGDYRLAEARLMKAVESVYAKYRGAMEAQHERVSQDLSVQMGHLRPQSQLRFTDSGLEIVIRFPVPLEQAASIDDEVTRSLLQAISAEPRLKLVGSGTPTIHAATDSGAAASH